MEMDEVKRYAIPLIVAVVIVTSVILLGLASENPDGFEWVLFDFAGVIEPEGWFEGIWTFLGEGPAVDAITGIIGIIAILLIGYGCFWLISRKTE